MVGKLFRHTNGGAMHDLFEKLGTNILPHYAMASYQDTLKCVSTYV